MIVILIFNSRGRYLLLTSLVRRHTSLTSVAVSRRKAMAAAGEDFKVQDAPSCFKLEVWQHFGFPKSENEMGEKITDKTKTVCRYCKKIMNYTNSTTNIMHHSEMFRSRLPERKKLLKCQTTLTSRFVTPLGQTSARAIETTRCIGVFMASDMRPFSVVDNEGFRLLVNTLEPKYCIPSHPHFSQSVMPALYKETSEWQIAYQLLQTAGPPGLPRVISRSQPM